MEFVPGTTLRQWLDARPRETREILDAFAQAGRGLAAAHAAGIVHRDFKPNNVLVGDDGRVRVIDFGLAALATTGPNPGGTGIVGDQLVPLGRSPIRLAARGKAAGAAFGVRAEAPGTILVSASAEPNREAAAEVRQDFGRAERASQITRTGAVLGTPAYMAPEQARGESLGAASDQYSFCVALHEALFGNRPPRDGSDPDETKPPTPVRPKEAAAPAGPPPARRRVAARVRRALARGLYSDPQLRYPSMETLLAELDQNRQPAWKRGATMAAVVLAAAGTVTFAGHRNAPAESLVCRGSERKLAGVWDDARKENFERAFLATGKPFAARAWQGASQALDAYAHDWMAMRTDACEATRLRGEQSEHVLDLRMACLDDHLRQMSAATDLLAHADEKVVTNAFPLSQSLPRLDDCTNVKALTARGKPAKDERTASKVSELKDRLATVRAMNGSGKYREALPLSRGHRPRGAKRRTTATSRPMLSTGMDGCWDGREAGSPQTKGFAARPGRLTPPGTTR